MRQLLKSLVATEESRPHQTTLLGIPHELRDAIFEYVYETTSGPVSLFLYRSGWRETGRPRTQIFHSQVPPSVDLLLLCRHFYTEMRSMQAAAFRQYWGTNAFQIVRSNRSPSATHR
jgi:hypothetical protein